MKIVFACGGTAGHINPAIAMAHILQKAHTNCEVLFFGRPDSMESTLIAKEGYDMHPIKVQAFKRSLSPKNLSYAKNLLSAYKEAKAKLKSFSPDAVIGTGGYVCYPVLRAAMSLHIPVAVHESNAIPGLSVKLLARKCDQLWLGFESAKEKCKCKKGITVTGNPLREGFHYADRRKIRRQLGLSDTNFVVLSFGGSGGAEAINEAMAAILKADLPPQLRVIHICGEKYRYMFESLSVPAGHRWFTYAANMPQLMQAADLIVCRCGAMTLSEVAFLQKPSILIPSPNVKANHQYYNGKALADANAAILLQEKDLSASRLLSEIKAVQGNAHLRHEMKRNLSAFSPKNTDKKILQALENLLSV